MKFLIILIFCVTLSHSFIDDMNFREEPSCHQQTDNLTNSTTFETPKQIPINMDCSNPVLGCSWESYDPLYYADNYDNRVKTGRDFQGIDYHIIRDSSDHFAIGKHSKITNNAFVVKNGTKQCVTDFQVRIKFFMT